MNLIMDFLSCPLRGLDDSPCPPGKMGLIRHDAAWRIAGKSRRLVLAGLSLKWMKGLPTSM
jgi:hypothetical protein